jgi:tetratricopeptide (TPR) repeat protein
LPTNLSQAITSISIEEDLRKGNDQYRVGNLEQAELIYRSILIAQPNHLDAMHNLGVLLVRAKDFNSGMEYLKSALTFNQKKEQYWVSYIDGLIRSGQIDSARNLLIQARQKGLHGSMIDQLNARLSSFTSNKISEVENSRQLSSAQPSEDILKSIDNKSAIELHATGIIHHKNKDFLKAHEFYCKALQLKPDWAEVYKDIGNNFLVQKKYSDAITSYQKAISIDSTYIAPVKNLGAVEYFLGNIEEAIYYFKRGHERDPTCNGTLYNLGTSYYLKGDQVAAIACLNKIIKRDPDNWVIDSAAYLAVLHYLHNDSQSSKEIINAFIGKTSKGNTKLHSYFSYLELLTNRQDSKNQLNNDNFLYAIGESHALVPHGLSVSHQGGEISCISKWIVGCKQWHLGNDQSNLYKYKFEAIIQSLPRVSEILLLFGEIDCRLDEGIIPFLKKNPEITMESAINNTISSYIDYVSKIAKEYDHELTISGIPAPNINFEFVSEQDSRLLIRLIKIFNESLCIKAIQSGHNFLDVYALTNRGDGISNKEWHIDDFHLKPSAIPVLFNDYYVQAVKLP